METLPIERVRRDFASALAAGPVVVSSPTGSGKSTQVPRWCPGRVLVVEPRRVACRSLAQRVAELEGRPLGADVGYHVRDERRAGPGTRILFATPGVVLRIFDDAAGCDTIVLDEFHERSLEVDLLLALLLRRYRGKLVVMSATLEGERVAAHLSGRHLHAEGRTFPVDVGYLPGRALLPDVRGLEDRLLRALEATRDTPGDVLVFLPGKGEIAGCAQALGRRRDVEVLELHGGLSLEQQSRAFLPAPRRKVILATNVAETSVTLPGVGVVIDSGLVRQTRYHRGRGFLTLVPVALDSAEQRAGRAGRTAPGVCLRLWSEAAQLEARTPPEVHRQSLVPLVLAAAACGEEAGDLPYLDPPRRHALEAARLQLQRLGGLDGAGVLTERGRRLFGLPLDAPLGRLLVEAEARETEAPGVLPAMIDLVSALAVDRPLLTGTPAPDDEGDAPGAARSDARAHCDAVALVRAVRRGRPPAAGGGGGEEGTRRDRRDPRVLAEALGHRDRLRRAFGLPLEPAERSADPPVDRRQLALTVLAADPRAAHVARRRGRKVAWSNGGTEVELGRGSRVAKAEGVEAIAVLETRALGLGGRDTRVLVTCAMPVPVAWLVEAGLGRDRLGEPTVADGRVVANIERVYARRVLAVREEVPQGRLARRAVARLFLAGRLFPESRETTADRLEAARLALALAAGGLRSWEGEVRSLYGREVPTLEAWVTAQLRRLGVESGEDLALLSAGDLLAPELPLLLRQDLDREFPRRLHLPGGDYEADYDVERREVTLRKVKGMGSEPPALTFLPRFAGFGIRVAHGQRSWRLRPPQ